jgi:APA family basic amino acid/polyamine antiporter
MTDTAATGSPPHAPGGPALARVMGPKLLLLFIVGDILGTGVYALTGTVAGEVGGAAWAPFLVAFIVATITAFSYLELVTRYPQAAGAALYAHRAFGLHFLTFLVAFTVMCSGITSASTASNAFAGFLSDGFGLGFEAGSRGILLLALGFMTLVAAINFRGVGESVKANVVLTCVELSGLLLIIFVGFWAMSQGRADFSEVMVFRSSEEKSAFLALTAATSLAFFAMVGFEDSVNMAEECTNPVRDFPRVMLLGLGITGLIYVLVSICAVALVPVGDLTDTSKGSALTQVVRAGAPNLPFDRIFPFIGMFAVANSALINMLMASRLLYGLARQGVLPHALGRVHPIRLTPWVAILFTTALAFGLIYFVVTNSQAQAISLLGGTTALLLLCVFTIVNIALIVIRRRVPSTEKHFRTPTILPWLGAFSCAFLVGPWARSAAQMPQYRIAAWLLAIGIALWALTWAWNRLVRHRTGELDPEVLAKGHGSSPHN